MHSKDPGTSIKRLLAFWWSFCDHIISINIHHISMILSSIAPGYAREEQGLSRNFRMDPPASPARWDWAIRPRDRPKSSNMTDIDWHPNSSNIFQHPISQTTVWMYDSYTSFAWLCYVLVSWMAVTHIVVWPTWVFESQQFELSLSARIQAACSTQI